MERSEIVRVEARSDDEAAQLVRDDETLFNPNKHRLTVLEGDEPRAGEVWIEQDDGRARSDGASTRNRRASRGARTARMPRANAYSAIPPLKGLRFTK